jgi:hypothetical protein
MDTMDVRTQTVTSVVRGMVGPRVQVVGVCRRRHRQTTPKLDGI